MGDAHARADFGDPVIEASVKPLWRRASLYAILLPCTVATHVFLFAALFWPIYSDGGRIPSRWAMGATMFRLNFQSDTIIYIGLIGLSALRLRWRMRPSAPKLVATRVHARR